MLSSFLFNWWRAILWYNQTNYSGGLLMSIEHLIIENKQELNQNDLDTLLLLNDNLARYVDLTIIELSQKVHMSKSYLLKLSQKLGFSGYSEFRYYLKQLHAKNEKLPMTMTAQELLMSDIQATNDLLSQLNFLPTIEAIQKAEHIFCYGTGVSQQSIVRQLSKNLMLVGKIVVTLQTHTEFMANMPLMSKNDLLVVASVSGETKDILDQLRVLQMRKVELLAITQFKSNTIANIANYKLFFQTTPYKIVDSESMFFSFVPLDLAVDVLLRHYIDFFNQIEKDKVSDE